MCLLRVTAAWGLHWLRRPLPEQSDRVGRTPRNARRGSGRYQLMPRKHATDPSRIRHLPPSEVTALKLHPSLQSLVLDRADGDMRRVEIVRHNEGVITEVLVHNRQIR